MHHLLLGVMYTVEAMFFVGLAGCALAVVLSWIDILRDGFKDDEPKATEQPHNPGQGGAGTSMPFTEASRAAVS